MNNIKIIYNSLISVLFTIQYAATLFGCEVSCSGCLRLFRPTIERKIINHVRVEFINFIIKGTGHDDIRYVILHCNTIDIDSPVNRGFTACSVDCSINAVMPLSNIYRLYL